MPIMRELNSRSQAQALLIEARKEVMRDMQAGMRKPPQAEDGSYSDGFTILTNTIQKIYRRGE